MLGRLSHRFGRRGAVLLLIGALWILQGIGIGFARGNLSSGDINSSLLHEYIPTSIRVALWTTTGAIAVLYAFRRGDGADELGWAALVLMPIERTVSYLWGFLMFIVPGIPAGYEPGLIRASGWAAIAGVIVIIAGWPEPKPLPPDDPDPEA